MVLVLVRVLVLALLAFDELAHEPHAATNATKPGGRAY